MRRQEALPCALCVTPAAAQNFLDGVVSINVTMTKEETDIASQYGVGDGYHGRRTVSGERFNAYGVTGASYQAVRQPHLRYEQGQRAIGESADR
jgi:hypothetical protein